MRSGWASPQRSRDGGWEEEDPSDVQSSVGGLSRLYPEGNGKPQRIVGMSVDSYFRKMSLWQNGEQITGAGEQERA